MREVISPAKRYLPRKNAVENTSVATWLKECVKQSHLQYIYVLE